MSSVRTDDEYLNWRCIVCGSLDVVRIGETGGFPLRECRACGLQFLSPRPGKDELERIYADYYHSWDLNNAREEVSRMKKRTFGRYLRYVAQYAPSGRLLDVGCATGELMSVAQDMGYDVYGVEISPEGIERCRALFGNTRISSALEQGDVPVDFFDVVTLCDVLEHLDAPGEFLSTMTSFLKPGGILLIVTPDTSSWTRRLMGASWPHYKKEHLYYFNRTTIKRLLPSNIIEMEVTKAEKCLTIRYCRNIIEADHRSTIGARFFRLLQHLPRRLQTRPITVSFGEMLVLARKEVVA